MSPEFVRKQGFKLKKIKKPIYVRNVNDIFNKEGLIEHTMKMNIFYKDTWREWKLTWLRAKVKHYLRYIMACLLWS